MALPPRSRKRQLGEIRFSDCRHKPVAQLN
jgi:hypothetical protein